MLCKVTHCTGRVSANAQEELEAESQGFLGSLWEESEGCHGTLYSTLFNCGMEGEYQDMPCQGL